MKPPFHQTAYKSVTTRNAYGDYLETEQTEHACHLREINEIVSDTNNEYTQSDAMAWFEPDSGIERGDILTINSQPYRVERLIKARRLRSETVWFLKATLQKYGTIS